MNTYRMVITTCEGPHRLDYIYHTIKSLGVSGAFDDKRLLGTDLIDSGSSSEFISKLTQLHRLVGVQTSHRRLNLNQNRIKSLQWAAVQKVDYIISMNDDVEVCSNFINEMDKWLSHNNKERDALYTMFVPYGLRNRGIKQQHNRIMINPYAFWGCCCLVMKPHIAKSIAMWSDQYIKTPDVQYKSTGYDLIIGRLWSIDKKVPIYGPIKSMVKHIGIESSH